jgi:hypothetical protein
MDENYVESDELGTTIIKKQMDYLSDCNNKFKTKSLISPSKKRELIEDILIDSFSKFMSISDELNIKDECVLRTYFYIQGLRDSIKTDKMLELKWKSEEQIKFQMIDLILTLSQYSEKEICLLKKQVVRKFNNMYKNIQIPFKNNILFRRADKIELMNSFTYEEKNVKKLILKYCKMIVQEQIILLENNDDKFDEINLDMEKFVKMCKKDNYIIDPIIERKNVIEKLDIKNKSESKEVLIDTSIKNNDFIKKVHNINDFMYGLIAFFICLIIICLILLFI